jgi:hypothetical protein
MFDDVQHHKRLKCAGLDLLEPFSGKCRFEPLTCVGSVPRHPQVNFGRCINQLATGFKKSLSELEKAPLKPKKEPFYGEWTARRQSRGKNTFAP